MTSTICQGEPIPLGVASSFVEAVIDQAREQFANANTGFRP